MPPSKRSMSEQFGEVMGLAALLPISVLVGYVMGHYLDQWLGTTYLTTVFLLLGAASGIISLVREIQKSSKKNG